MTLAQQLAAVMATIALKEKAMEGVLTKAATEKRTNNDTEEAEIKAIEADIGKLTINKSRLESLITSANNAAKTATPVAGATHAQGQASMDGDPEPEKAATKSAQTAHNRNEKGIAFAQYAKAKALSIKMARNGNFVSPAEIAKSQGMMPRVVEALTKANEVMDTTNSSSLVVVTAITDEFIELLRDKTIVDKLSDKMRATPFNTSHAGMGTGTTAAWVGEGKPKPVTTATFIDVEVKHHKLAGISVMTDELIMLNSYSADKRVRDDLVESCAALMDATFVDGEPQDKNRPGGMLDGAPKITATGITAEAYKSDISSVRAHLRAAKLSLSGAYYLMSETRASDMADLTDALGNPVYRGMDAGVNEKTLKGIPVIESETMPDIIILIKPSEIYLADDESVSIDYSDQATITMADGTQVNLYQENKQAIRAERHVTWAKRRAVTCAYIDYSAVTP